MYYRRRPRYVYSGTEPKRKKRSGGFAFALLLMICVFLVASSLFLRELSAQIAVSDASDAVTNAVNDAIRDIICENDYPADWFVSMEKDFSGKVCSVNGNMAHINALSAELLDRVIASTDNGTITVNIPAGNLSGIDLLLGKGPEVPVKIIVLTSSKVDLRNEIFSLGINQSKYQLYLEVSIDVDVLVPWGVESATVITEVLVADTVIVGQVPETYLDMEK